MSDTQPVRGRAQRRAKLTIALAAEEDALIEAKEVFADDPTPETREAKKAAMASFAETRTWLRAKARLAEANRHVVEYENASDDKGRRRYAKAVEDLERIPIEHGQLLADMDALAAGGA